MWTYLAGLMKSNGTKLSFGAIGGSGLIALIIGLHQDVTAKINRQDAQQKEYVVLVLAPLQTEIQHLQSEQKETKEMVRDIHKYLLQTK